MDDEFEKRFRTRSVRDLANVMELFADLRRDMPLQLIRTFLMVAADPGRPFKDYGKRLGISQSSMSRHMAELAEWGQRGNDPLHLIESFEDPEERRRKCARLTPKGEQTRDRLVDLLGGDRGD
tara:strand:+ start:4063 stop:4431 length:369 start_codon:yes stop_codon:yes gene_type:complete